MNSGTSTRQRRMVSLGKVTAPKPVNLPSQKKESNQTEVLLSNKPTTSWGANTSNDREDGQLDERHSGHMPPPRVIPAQPMPAWGGAGLPEERQKTLELANREQFPTLGATAQDEKRQESNGHAYNPRDEFRQRGDRGQYWDQDDRRMYSDSRDRRYGGDDPYYNEEIDDMVSPRDRRMSQGYRRRPHPREYYHYEDDYLPEDYEDHARDRHRFNYDDREYYPERYDTGDRYEQRPGRYERPPHRGGYGVHDRRFGPRGVNGDMYSPRRGGYGGFRDDYYGGYGGRGGHGRRREDLRRGERFYEEEEEQEVDQVETSTGKAPPPPPPPRRPPPPPPPGISGSTEEVIPETEKAGIPMDNSEENVPSEHDNRQGENQEAKKQVKVDSINSKKTPVKILKREPESINLEIDLGTQVSRPASRADDFVPDTAEQQHGFSVSHDAMPPSLQGLSLHPITFGDQSVIHTAEHMGSEAVTGFENPEHPPGLFTSMEHDSQQQLMNFGADTEGKHNAEDLSLLLNGFESTFEKSDKDAAQPLQFGDIVLPSTIDGCVEVDSSQNQARGNQHRRDSAKPRGRGRGRGYRGRGRGAQHIDKANGNLAPPPPPPPTSKKTDIASGQKQVGPKQGKTKKKKSGKEGAPPSDLAQNGIKSAVPAGEKKKSSQRKPHKKKQTAVNAAAVPAGVNATEGKAS